MKKSLALLVALGSLISLGAASSVDPYMGDWGATLGIDGKGEMKEAVQMIPRGNGRYEVKMYSEWDKRLPVQFHLQGQFRDDNLQLIDAIPFEVSRIIRPVDDGLVVRAALWTGQIVSTVVEGRIAGATHGGFVMSPVVRLSPDLGKRPPAGAVVLFDGSNLDQWKPRDPNKSRVEWKLVEDGAMEVSGGDIVTKGAFGDQQLHLEFRTPYMPEARGQGRGNSGVYPTGRYEVQVLDSYGLDGADNECGGIYQISRPKVNMCAPPLQWQTYDITFRLARFDAQGKKTDKARITVVQNGVVIQDNVELPSVTGGAYDDKEQLPGPLMLQDHGNPVRYRNIWVKPLG